MIFKQLFDGEVSAYTYLIADDATHEAALIDPVKEHVADYLNLLSELKLTLKFSLETHTHADHITGSGELKQKTACQTGASNLVKAECISLRLKENDMIKLGTFKIRVLTTPGHTPCSLAYLVEGHLFTGDSLLIDGCGRTDFQDGSAEALWETVTQKLFRLPPDTFVYPGHDYNGRRVSTIKQEMDSNSRFAGKTKADFIKIMQNLNLEYPKKIHEALPANEKCGLP